MDKILKILTITSNPKLRTVLEFCFDGWGYEVYFSGSEKPDIQVITRISPDIIIVDIDSKSKSDLSICDKLKKELSTVYVPVITLIDKEQLRTQLLDLRYGIDDYIIKPPDSLELRTRLEMAVKRSQLSFYANPLTGLPGSMIIEKVTKEKLESKKHFVIGHVDIDNFKSFNDKYGYVKGDRVLMQTAYMLTEAMRTVGNSDDFIGHIGGDDFLIITTPEKYNDICRNFICMFDTITPFLYSDSDRKHGFITAKDRAGEIREIPLMSVTIALFLRNSSEETDNIIELNERIAEIKQYLKTIPGSKYLADRRIMQKSDHLKVQVFSNDKTVIENYQPLGKILLENNVITIEQLDKALKVHWRRGALLGEVLTELGFLSKDKLQEALSYQEGHLEKM